MTELEREMIVEATAQFDADSFQVSQGSRTCPLGQYWKANVSNKGVWLPGEYWGWKLPLALRQYVKVFDEELRRQLLVLPGSLREAARRTERRVCGLPLRGQRHAQTQT